MLEIHTTEIQVSCYRTFCFCPYIWLSNWFQLEVFPVLVYWSASCFPCKCLNTFAVSGLFFLIFGFPSLSTVHIINWPKFFLDYTVLIFFSSPEIGLIYHVLLCIGPGLSFLSGFPVKKMHAWMQRFKVWPVKAVLRPRRWCAF